MFRPNYRSFPICQASFEVECHYLLSARSRHSNRLSASSFDYSQDSASNVGMNPRAASATRALFMFFLYFYKHGLCLHPDFVRSQRLMAAFLRLQPALLPSSSRLRRIPVSTGSRKIAYLSEFILHRRNDVSSNQFAKRFSRCL